LGNATFLREGRAPKVIRENRERNEMPDRFYATENKKYILSKSPFFVKMDPV
jgi:hypothetical protein